MIAPAERAIVFDFDGVVIDSMGVQEKAFKSCYASLCGGGAPPWQEFTSMSGAGLPHIISSLGLPDEMVDMYRSACTELLHEVHPVSGMPELLERLRRRGHPVGMCTGKDRERTLATLNSLGLEAAFDYIVCGDDGVPEKPSPEAVGAVLRHLGARPDVSVMVGDAVNDILSGRGAGVATVGVSWGADSVAALSEAGAEHVVDSVVELENWLMEELSLQPGACQSGWALPAYAQLARDVDLPTRLRELDVQERILVVTDEIVAPLHLDHLVADLQAGGYRPSTHVIPAGEDGKTWNTLRSVLEALTENELERDSAVIALGGGVVGDVAGLAASIFKRGLAFVNIPTSLLAQVDSSVGGKTAVNFGGVKNLVGTFHSPVLVLLDRRYLNTLPDRLFCAGLAEVLVHACIADPWLFEYLEIKAEAILTREQAALETVVRRAVAVKAMLITEDPFDRGVRAHLNLGHTFGHGIEVASGFSFNHGESVALGVMCAYAVAEGRDLVTRDDRLRVRTLAQRLGLPVSWPGGDIRQVVHAMRHDKKVRNGRLRLVLPRGIGDGTVVECESDEHLRVLVALTATEQVAG